MATKQWLGIDVLTAAKRRISKIFDHFPKIYLSGPSGKDSGVMMHLVCQEARRRGRKVGVLYVDLEAQYESTIAFVEKMFAEYADVIEPYWLCLPVALRNAVSQYQPKWTAWEPGAAWVRQPPKIAITDPAALPWYTTTPVMEFEEIVPAFAEWYAQGQPCACFVGIRAQESLNRWRAVTRKANRWHDPDSHEPVLWTTWKGETVFNAYPIYDWRTEDIWRYYGKTGATYPRTYDLMYRAGLSVHQMRICQPYGDDQRKGLYLWHILEPETWARVVARVAGASMGALYAQERGNVLGRINVTKPDGATWESYAKLLLAGMPAQSREQYENKIAVFVHWWQVKGVPMTDEADPKLEAAKKAPSWRRVVKMILKNDYWAKSLSFGPTKSEAFAKYQQVMKRRRARWGL